MKANLSHYRKIFNDVEKRNISGLYLLHGQETFIMEEMANKIAASVVPEDLKAFNMTTAYGSEVDIDEFVGAAHSYPFLADHRVLVLRELEKLRGSWKRLIEYCGNPAPASVVILLYHPFDDQGNRVRAPRDFGALETAVTRVGKVIAFDRLGTEGLMQWVIQHSKRAGVEMDAATAEALIESVGLNLFDLQNEITKLSLYVSGRGARLEDLRAVVGNYRVGALSELLGGIRPGKASGSLRTLAGIIGTGAERPAGVLYQLTRHFLTIVKIKAGCEAEGPWAEGARRAAPWFTEREVFVWLENLRRTELLMKTSAFPEEALLVGAFTHSMRGTLTDSPVFER